jgi:predicted NBD/HSP70 family sugar kinase
MPEQRTSEILRSVHREPGRARAAVARELGISSGLATETVARLIDAGLIDEIPGPPSGTRGRPSRQLGPHPRGPLVASIAIAYAGWTLALVELGGQVVTRHAGRHDRRWPPLRRTLRRQLARVCADHPDRVVALCISVPGTVSRGRLIQAPNLGWADIDLRSAFPAPGPLGTFVDNDATASALGEARRGSSRGQPSVVHVFMDHGIGGALLEDGAVVGGALGIAGEFGHMPFGSPTARCSCGALGCWNTAVDGPALAARLGESDPDDVAAFTLELLRRAVQARGPHRRVAHAAADALGRGLAGLVNGLDPAVVCLGGLAVDLRRAAPERVDAAYRRGLMSSRRSTPPPIVDGRLGEPGPLLGVAEHGFDALLTDHGLALWKQR